MNKFLIGAVALSIASVAGAVTPIGNGTVSVAALYNPAVNTTASPSTFTATLGNTFEVNGGGSFAAVTGLTGIMNGTLSFSSSTGTTTNQSLSNFFVFNDGMGGTYNFSPTSVFTQTYSITPNVSSSISLYVLGNTLDTKLNFDPTPTSLTISFNSTGGSPYAASATLAIPPAGPGVVPEPTTWALLMVGFGMVGFGARRRRNLIAT